jgi:hypothetical protein
MTAPTHFKCLSCKEEHKSEPRNRGRQRYCAKVECRRASKAASQGRWLSRPENVGYFRGTEHGQRVKRWRKAHPGYRRRGKGSGGRDVLQETLKSQETENKEVATPDLSNALQDICAPQLALIVGIISILTGDALQEDIAASARRFLSRGRDILGMGLGGSDLSHDPKHAHLVPRAAAARASPV